MSDHLFGITDKGRVRDNNEDLFIAEEIMGGQFIIAGVIDGVGGYEGGEIAAALTKEIILDELYVIGNDLITQLEIAFNLANEEILGRKLVNPELSGMACVATIAVIDRKNNLLHYIHVGDTRLYLFRDNSLVKISHDQSFVGFLEDSGRLTEEAAMNHPKRNQINQALGLESRMGLTDSYFETGTSPFLPGDLILLCSDGLTDLVDKTGIISILSKNETLKVKGELLIESANNAGGKDNVTVVLAKNDKAQVVHDKARPTPVAQSTLFNDSIPAPDRVMKQTDVIRDPSDDDHLSKVKNDTIYAKPKNSNVLVVILSVLCVLLLVTSVWLFWNKLLAEKVKNTPKLAAVPVLNPQEKLLQNQLASLKSDTLILSDSIFKGPVILSKALSINRDTLIIKTKGNIVFRRDSAYKGPAMVFGSSVKYVFVPQMVFENFEIGIVAYNNALSLNNTQFINCKQSVQTLFLFPDRFYINGRISKRAFQTDSIAKK